MEDSAERRVECDRKLKSTKQHEQDWLTSNIFMITTMCVH